MAVRQIARKAYDWAGIASRVPADLRPAINDLRARYEQLHAKLEQTPQAESIDWDFYASTLGPARKNVEEMKKAVEQTKLPDFAESFSKQSAEIDKAEKESTLKAKSVIQDATRRIAKLREQLVAIDNMKPVDELTAEDQLAAHPEWAKQIQADWDRYMFFETDTLKPAQK